MVSVTSVSRYMTSASRYHPRYQSRSSMYIRGLIPRNFAELAEAVPIDAKRLIPARLITLWNLFLCTFVLKEIVLMLMTSTVIKAGL